MPARTIGRYRLEERLGSGGMGEVFAALDVESGKRVALKVLPPAVAADEAVRERFRREARAVAKLRHPGIARLYEFGEAEEAGSAGKTLYLAMELVRGETLQTRYSLAPPGHDEFVDLATQLAAALQAAHDAGVIHRDLKPANVRIDAAGRTKILDFGLAKIEGEGTKGAGTTARGRIVGTTPYLAPELFQGRGAGPSSDLFSLGVLLYQTLSGRL
ncbi:MAG: serine/threonine-protein kinase, partial [Thermoanaerobaculia bacterium]|nr:serine/threonine-protein kinase [Thermoanaerobaculia bacterium]